MSGGRGRRAPKAPLKNISLSSLCPESADSHPFSRVENRSPGGGGSGQKVRLEWGDHHGLQLIRQHMEDLVKLLVALRLVGQRPRMTPEQTQGELCPEGLQQLGDGLPASCRSNVTDVPSDTKRIVSFHVNVLRNEEQAHFAWTGSTNGPRVRSISTGLV